MLAPDRPTCSRESVEKMVLVAVQLAPASEFGHDQDRSRGGSGHDNRSLCWLAGVGRENEPSL
jgi:hypothetical protein